MAAGHETPIFSYNGYVCNPRRTAFSNSLIITRRVDKPLLTSLMLNQVETALERCPLLLHRAALTALNVGMILLSGVVWFVAVKTLFVKRSSIMEMIKNIFMPTKKETRPRIEIIHPIDSFSSPPSITNESTSTSIRLKFTKFSTRGRRSGRILIEALRSNSPPSSATSEHLSVNELHSSQSSESCFVSPSLMDSLPDPPHLSVERLPQLERIFRTEGNSTGNTSASLPHCLSSAPSSCLASDGISSKEYLNLQPIPKTRPSKSYPRSDYIFRNESTALSQNTNTESTSFIEQLDVRTLLTTESSLCQHLPSIPSRYPRPRDSASCTHTILIDEGCSSSRIQD
ncbi:hypothetical protein RB195_002313 [Necator americanus]|uniref:Uncharacterized protein n=1 Tax=Necator americanus TaxID=51031 RepID=A0ABR1DJ72_NECAM